MRDRAFEKKNEIARQTLGRSLFARRFPAVLLAPGQSLKTRVIATGANIATWPHFNRKTWNEDIIGVFGRGLGETLLQKGFPRESSLLFLSASDYPFSSLIFASRAGTTWFKSATIPY